MAAAAIIAAAAVICVSSLCCGAQDRVPVTIGVPEASETADAFCAALSDGDMAAVEEMIFDYADLGLARQPESDGAQALLECLHGSFSCTPEGECRESGIDAEQDIRVTYFSVWQAEEYVRGRAQELYDQRLAAAESNEELYDETGNLLESVAKEIYEQALNEVISEAEKYYVTERTTMELVYSDGSWQIVLTDPMVEILLGGINRH